MGLGETVSNILEDNHKAKNAKENRFRVYNDIAFILWYTLLYEDILKYKHESMEMQEQPFRIYDFGNNAFRFGPVVALTSKEDIDKFEKQAKAVLADKGYGKVRVKVHSDSIVVSWR